MPKLVCLLTALMLISGVATAHSWYPKECCHDKDCRPVPCASDCAIGRALHFNHEPKLEVLIRYGFLKKRAEICVTS